jgi:hypothetical protein
VNRFRYQPKVFVSTSIPDVQDATQSIRKLSTRIGFETAGERSDCPQFGVIPELKSLTSNRFGDEDDAVGSIYIARLCQVRPPRSQTPARFGYEVVNSHNFGKVDKPRGVQRQIKSVVKKSFIMRPLGRDHNRACPRIRYPKIKFQLVEVAENPTSLLELENLPIKKNDQLFGRVNWAERLCLSV